MRLPWGGFDGVRQPLRLLRLLYVVNGLFLYFAQDTVHQLGGADVLAKAIYADTLFRSLSFSRLPLFLLALVV